MLIKKIKRFHLSKNKNFDLLNYKKMDIKSLEIKNKTNWDGIININYFNSDLLKVIKIKSKIGGDYIYHILYNPNPDYNILKSLYFFIGHLNGYIEEIEGSSDKYLVVASRAHNKNIISVIDISWTLINDKINSSIDMVWTSIKNKINPGIKIKDYDKFRFNSNINLPLNSIIKFHSLVINISCVIKKNNEYYPEIYLNECSYNNTKV